MKLLRKFKLLTKNNYLMILIKHYANHFITTICDPFNEPQTTQKDEVISPSKKFECIADIIKKNLHSGKWYMITMNFNQTYS